MGAKRSTKVRDAGIGDIPEIKFESMGTGTCPICFQTAHVSVHRRNGYFVRCLSCSLNLFTRSPIGAVLFRAQQIVLADPELRATLSGAAAPHYERLMSQMLVDPPANDDT
jgi:hypothetical protein